MSEVINVIGLGYIGLPTALMLASKGLKVIGTDLDEKKVDMLQNSSLTFQEEGLAELYQKAVLNGIQFISNSVTADVYIVAVPTPFHKQNKKIVE